MKKKNKQTNKQPDPPILDKNFHFQEVPDWISRELINREMHKWVKITMKIVTVLYWALFKHYRYIISFSSHSNLLKLVLFSFPLYRWETWCSERLGNFPRDTDQGQDREEIWAQVCLPPEVEHLNLGPCSNSTRLWSSGPWFANFFCVTFWKRRRILCNLLTSKSDQGGSALVES